MAVDRDAGPMVNASNLWYGGDVGIEIVERTGTIRRSLTMACVLIR
jgi:hypothetical protein